MSIYQSRNYKLDLSHPEYLMIDNVLNKCHKPFMNLKCPVYDQLIYMVTHGIVSIESLKHCLNSYLSMHCFSLEGNCTYIPEVAFMHWENVPHKIPCKMCTKVLNLDYVIRLFEKGEYISNEIYLQSTKNLKYIENNI